MAKSDDIRIKTLLATAGLKPEENFGIPNPPIYRTSTILSESLAHYRNELPSPYDYGRVGTPTSDAFETAVSQLYRADDTISTPSGLSAVAVALLSFVKAGDHILLPDSMYGAARNFVTKTLINYGAEIEFYPPQINAGISDLIKENTSLLYCESPGSLTFEIQDIPAMTDIAKAHGIITLIDNTWGTALHFDAFAKGIDIVIEAGTKYITGHSDTNLGVICGHGAKIAKVRLTARTMGICAGPEDLYLGARGLRTMHLRLKETEKNGLALAQFAETQDVVTSVLHPALPSSPDHALYTRDFTGSCGLFGFMLDKRLSQDAIDKAAAELQVMRIGASWGGFESLFTQAVLTDKMRSHREELAEGYLMRVYAGLEDQADLLADLARFFAALGDAA